MFDADTIDVRDPFLNLVKQSNQHNCFYHFTDRRNVQSIQNQGGILSMRKLRELDIDVPAPGGNQWSFDADKIVGMDAYVHLCFMREHPMVDAAKTDERIEEIAWLEINPEIIKLPNVMITLDVSNKSGVTPMKVKDALGDLDTEVIYKWTYWKDPLVQRRLKCAKKCEILVPDMIPLHHISNLNG